MSLYKANAAFSTIFAILPRHMAMLPLRRFFATIDAAAFLLLLTRHLIFSQPLYDIATPPLLDGDIFARCRYAPLMPPHAAAYEECRRCCQRHTARS